MILYLALHFVTKKKVISVNLVLMHDFGVSDAIDKISSVVV